MGGCALEQFYVTLRGKIKKLFLGSTNAEFDAELKLTSNLEFGAFGSRRLYLKFGLLNFPWQRKNLEPFLKKFVSKKNFPLRIA